MNRVYAVRETILSNDRETRILSPMYATRERAKVRKKTEDAAHKDSGSIAYFYDVLSFQVKS